MAGLPAGEQGTMKAENAGKAAFLGSAAGQKWLENHKRQMHRHNRNPTYRGEVRRLR